MIYCYTCNHKIKNNSNIYKSFDYSFCSIYCRDKITNIITQNDPNFNYPQKWNKMIINNFSSINLYKTYTYVPINIKNITINMNNFEEEEEEEEKKEKNKYNKYKIYAFLIFVIFIILIIYKFMLIINYKF
jgi:hypothetical protein